MNLNEVKLIGNLTRDPECRMFANGGKVAQFGIAVNERRKNNSTGQYEDHPQFFDDIKAFNRGNFKLADYIEQQLRKGSKVLVVGKLERESWTTNDGQKRSKVVVIVDQFFELAGRGGGGGSNSSPASRPDDGGYQTDPPPSFGNEADIPF